MTENSPNVRRDHAEDEGPFRDITLIEDTPIDYLDFACPESGLGSKIGLDATNKWPPETKREIRMVSSIVSHEFCCCHRGRDKATAFLLPAGEGKKSA